MAIRKIDLSYFVFYIEKISFRWAHPEVQDDLLWIRCHDFRILLVPIAERFIGFGRIFVIGLALRSINL